MKVSLFVSVDLWGMGNPNIATSSTGVAYMEPLYLKLFLWNGTGLSSEQVSDESVIFVMGVINPLNVAQDNLDCQG